MTPILSALTEAVADGQEPDWSSLDLSALSDEERVQIDELRAVFDIGRCLATLSSGRTLSLSTTEGPVATSWGPLQIRERVGRGRFGDIYRAWDPAIARPVALKLLRRGDTPPAAAYEVVEEGRLMGRVRHPNVATIYGAAHHDGRTGLWMEFVEGRTLAAELKERGPLPAHEAAAVGVELCRALAAVHAAGLVHRDVKAQNVMRESSGRVVLGDFGTGLDLEEGRGPAVLAGTPVYLAPEIFNRQPASPQSDLYSLGVLLFHLVTGSFPVTGRSIVEIRQRHARPIRASLAELGPAVPRAFSDVVTRALAPDPVDRFADADDMARALTAVLSPPAVAPAPVHNGIADLTRRWSPSAKMLLAAAGIVITASTGFALWRSGVLGGVQRYAPRSYAAATAEPNERRLGRIPAPSGQFWGQPDPDGRLFTFVDMNGDLGVFDVGSGEPRILTDLKRSGGSAFESSVFSADGLQIAYAWGAADGMRELRIIPTAGGPSRVLWSDPDEVAHPIDWSGDGQQILVRLGRHDGTRQLGLISASTGRVRRLDAVDASHDTASLSPDGRYVVFDVAQDAEATERDVFVRAIEHVDRAKVLVSGSSDDFGPLWSPDGERVLFISDRTGEPSVWSIDVESGEPRGEPVILHRNIGRVTPYGVSTHGTLYYGLQVGLVDIFTARLDPARGTIVEPPQPIAPAQVGSKLNAHWSPDGRRIAYVRLPQAGIGANRTRRLVILEPASGTTRTLNPRLLYYSAPQWSPDGSHLLVYGWDQRLRRGAYLLDAVSGEVRPVALVGGATPHEIGAVAWGANAQSILIVRQKLGLMAVDLATGREHPVFTFAEEGVSGITPLPGFGLSPDRRSIAYSAYRRNAAGQNETVLRVKDVGATTRDLVVANLRFESWTPDGEILYTEFAGELLEQTSRLNVVSRATGPPRPIGLELKGLGNVKMRPDGGRITFTAGFPGNELWALENFLPERQ